MKISYNKLWKLLIDKKMKQSDLRRAANCILRRSVAGGAVMSSRRAPQ